MVEMKRKALTTRKEFEESLNVSVVGLKTAERNRKKYIKQLGEIYFEYAGKWALYEMFLTKEIRETGGLSRKTFMNSNIK